MIFDLLLGDGQTFAWELFADEARFTRMGTLGGHRNATPADLTTGVNFNDKKMQDDWLFMIEYWKPFMVTCAFPCTPHSPMQQLNRAQGLGERVDEIVADAEPLLSFTRKVLDAQARGGRIGVAENPSTSSACCGRAPFR